MKNLFLLFVVIGLLTACSSSRIKEENKTALMINSLQKEFEAAKTKLSNTNMMITEQKAVNEVLVIEMINLKKADEDISKEIEALKIQVDNLKKDIMEK
jgi:hypothetical protein